MTNTRHALNDKDLAQALSAGEPWALEALVRAHYDDLFRFMRHLTRHQEAAEDLCQQALLQAVRKVNSYRSESSLKTWLHRIAFREYTGWRRKRRILRPLSRFEAYTDPGYKQVEEAEALLSALHRLPDMHREVLLLFHVQDLSLEEIAVVTNTPVGTVKSRLHHARKRLQATTPEQENLCYEK